MTKHIPEEVKQYMASIGKKGGKQTSDAKTKAARENAKKPRGKRKPKQPRSR